ncbi:adenylosuccinate lyase [Bacteroidota bacterium]
MIPRYTRPEMGRIWEDENKYNIWLEIEVLACEAQAELGIIPKEAAKEIREKAKVDVQKILEIEETTKHDVIAFLTNVEEYVGEPSRYIHLGMTSSDVLDTCFAVQCKQSGELILEDLEKLSEVLARRAKEFKHTVCIGRSHGIHAEPMTFGMKFALWYDECVRNIRRIKHAASGISYGKINGAVGTFEHISPMVEKYVCSKLGLKPAPITTQVIQRDRHAMFLTTIAIVGSLLEKIAIEIRHLQRTEVLEAEEFFSKGQKGSSAMPHKRNPIASENITGQARLLRANAMAALENNALWHERDISHSSVERVIFPDSTISLDYIINRMTSLLDNLLVYPENMKKNMDITLGLYSSQKVLLELAKKGLKRQQAYELVQKSAMRTWKEKIPFQQTLQENEDLMKHITKEEIEKLFSFDEIFDNVDFIFERLGLK